MFDREGRRKYLNDKERRMCLKAIQGEADKARRAFCLTLYYTGCRISEALCLMARSVDVSQKSVVFETLKRRRRGIYRAVPVPDRLIALLRDIVRAKESGARVWTLSRPTAYRLVKRCMSVADIDGAMACPKGLRHGFAVACVANGVPLPIVQKWLGHARLETTAIYLGVTDDEERDLARRLWSDS